MNGKRTCSRGSKRTAAAPSPSLLRSLAVLAAPAVMFYTIGVVGFFLPIRVKELGGNYTVISLLATAYYATAAPASVLLGRVADVIGRPKLLLASGMLLNALTCALIGLVDDVKLLVVLRAVQGLALASSIPIAMIAASDVLGVGAGVGLTGTFNAAGFAAGALTGGLLSEALGFEGAFAAASLVSLFAATAVCLARTPYRRATHGGWVKDLALIPPRLWALYLALFLRNAGASGVFAVLPVYIKSTLSTSEATVGFLLALNPLSQMLFMRKVSRLAEGRELSCYAGGLALTSAVMLCYIGSGSPEAFAAANLLLGFTWSLIMVSANMYIVKSAPEAVRYTCASLFTTSFNAAWIVGTAVGGVWMDAHGVTSWMAVAAALSLAAAGIVSYVGALEKTISGTPSTRSAER